MAAGGGGAYNFFFFFLLKAHCALSKEKIILAAFPGVQLEDYANTWLSNG